ncbi:MAG: hypothetical protein PHU88_11385 [candidate division Zixibacteria bacterium]|nr:hypothetical protein [candidate division Zixibacteria bacterium]
MKRHLILVSWLATLFILPDCKTAAQPVHGHPRVDDFTVMTRPPVASLPNYTI